MLNQRIFISQFHHVALAQFLWLRLILRAAWFYVIHCSQRTVAIERKCQSNRMEIELVGNRNEIRCVHSICWHRRAMAPKISPNKIWKYSELCFPIGCYMRFGDLMFVFGEKNKKENEGKSRSLFSILMCTSHKCCDWELSNRLRPRQLKWREKRAHDDIFINFTFYPVQLDNNVN